METPAPPKDLPSASTMSAKKQSTLLVEEYPFSEDSPKGDISHLSRTFLGPCKCYRRRASNLFTLREPAAVARLRPHGSAPNPSIHRARHPRPRDPQTAATTWTVVDEHRKHQVTCSKLHQVVRV